MKVAAVLWDRNNRRHFAEHGRGTEDEVEEILLQKRHPSRVAMVAPGRYRFEGQTMAGRYLVVIAARVGAITFRPVTCWPIGGEALRRHLAWRKAIRR